MHIHSRFHHIYTLSLPPMQSPSSSLLKFPPKCLKLLLQIPLTMTKIEQAAVEGPTLTPSQGTSLGLSLRAATISPSPLIVRNCRLLWFLRSRDFFVLPIWLRLMSPVLLIFVSLDALLSFLCSSCWLETSIADYVCDFGLRLWGFWVLILEFCWDMLVLLFILL